ncbi:MAG TPA: hypothetical protein VGG48_14260 [Rhizomicrobium sp.]
MSDAKIKLVLPDPQKPRTVVWPCMIKQPADGGSFEQRVLDVRFKILSQKERERIFDEASKKEVPAGERRVPGGEALFDALVVEFPGFQDEAGQPVPFEIAADYLRREPAYRDAILTCFMNMIGGRLAGN